MMLHTDRTANFTQSSAIQRMSFDEIEMINGGAMYSARMFLIGLGAAIIGGG